MSIQKPYKIVKLDTPEDIERLDNLLTILYQNVQNKEFRHFDGTFPTANMVNEKEIVTAQSGGIKRIYTKIKGVLSYVVLT